jgi:lipoate-protein ligase A
MAVDEAILRQAGSRQSPPTLRLYAWQPACLSLGYAQPFADVDTARLRQRGWEVVRRPTGGRAILHADELTYSLCAALDEPLLQSATILESYQRLAVLLIQAAQSLGIAAEMASHAPATHTEKGPVCFEEPSAYEIVAGGKKLIGSAQARKKEGVLQHGSFPLHGDLTRITQALAFPNEQAREMAAQKLLGRATTAERVTGRVIPWETAAQALVRAFEAGTGLALERGELTGAEEALAEEFFQNKYAHPGWTERA